MLCCLTVKEVEQCCITGWIHQRHDQKTKNHLGLNAKEETETSSSLMFSDCVFFWLLLWNIITQLFVSHMSAGGSGGAQRIVKMTDSALCFSSFLDRERHHGAWVRWSICWNVGGTERQFSAYSVQLKYHNHSSHSEYCLIQPFHRTGNTTREISFTSVGVSCFVLVIALDRFYHGCCWKAGCLKKEEKKKSWRETWL